MAINIVDLTDIDVEDSGYKLGVGVGSLTGIVEADLGLYDIDAELYGSGVAGTYNGVSEKWEWDWSELGSIQFNHGRQDLIFVVRFTDGDDNTYDYLLKAAGQPKLRIRSFANSSFQPEVDFEVTSTSSDFGGDTELQNEEGGLNWSSLIQSVSGETGDFLLVLSTNPSMEGRKLKIKKRGCPHSAIATIDSSGDAAFIWANSQSLSSPGFDDIAGACGTNGLMPILGMGTGFHGSLEISCSGESTFGNLQWRVYLNKGQAYYDASGDATIDPWKVEIYQSGSVSSHSSEAIGVTSTVSPKVITSVPADDSESFDRLKISIDTSLDAATAWALSTTRIGYDSVYFTGVDTGSSIDGYWWDGRPYQLAFNNEGIFGYEELADAGDMVIFTPHKLLKGTNLSTQMDMHLRGKTIGISVDENEIYLKCNFENAPIVVGYFNGNDGQWYYSTSETPGANQNNVSEVLVPGATGQHLTIPGSHIPVYWAIVPMRGDLSCFFSKESITVDVHAGATETSSVVYGGWNDPGANWDASYGWAAFFAEADINWTSSAGATQDIVIDSTNLSGLGSTTYQLKIT